MERHESRWSVTIYIDEADDDTTAQARLATRDRELVGTGSARRNPADAAVPEIGEELAVARALRDLTHQWLDAAIADIEAITHRPAHVTAD